MVKPDAFTWRLCLPFNPQTMLLLGYPKVIPYSSLNSLGSFVFELCCGQTDKQTDRRTWKFYPHRPTKSIYMYTLISI